jgi:hypothetical protein
MKKFEKKFNVVDLDVATAKKLLFILKLSLILGIIGVVFPIFFADYISGFISSQFVDFSNYFLRFFPFVIKMENMLADKKIVVISALICVPFIVLSSFGLVVASSFVIRRMHLVDEKDAKLSLGSVMSGVLVSVFFALSIFSDVNKNFNFVGLLTGKNILMPDHRFPFFLAAINDASLIKIVVPLYVCVVFGFYVFACVFLFNPVKLMKLLSK